MKKNEPQKRSLFLLCVAIGLLFFLGGCLKSEAFDSGINFANENQWVRAVDSFREAIDQGVGESQQRQAKEQIAQLTEKIASEKTDEVQRRWGQGRTTRQCDEAIGFLTPFLPYDDAKDRIQDAISQYQEHKSSLAANARQSLQLANQEAAANNWSSALRAVESAIEIDPYNTEAPNQMHDLIRRRDTHYSARIEHFCVQEQWKEATDALDEFRRQTPSPETRTLDRLAKQIENIKIRVVSREAESQARQNKFLTAYRHMNDNDVARHNKELAEKIKNDGCAYYIQTAKHEKDINVRDFHAFAAALKATQLDPQNRQAGQLFQDYSRRVDESIQKEIGFVRFTSPASEPDSGNNIRIFMIDKIRSRLPYGYKIAEQQKVDVVIEKDGLEVQIHIYGIDYLVHGEVMTYNSEKSEMSNTITDWVDIKTTSRNPEYDRLKQLHGPDTRRWSNIPPEMIETVSLQEVTYQKGTTRIRGDMRVRCVFRMSEEGVDMQNIFTVTNEESAPFQTGVPRGGIPLIEKVNFSETDFKSKLMEEIVDQVGQWLLKALENPHKRYLQRGLAHAERGSSVQAVEAIAKAYLYCVQSDIPANDASFAMIRQSILYDLTE